MGALKSLVGLRPVHLQMLGTSQESSLPAGQAEEYRPVVMVQRAGQERGRRD